VNGAFLDGFASVVFDCDSTLVTIEGIDELAGARVEEIRQLTELAMEGVIPLEEVYGRRLEAISPTRDEVQRIGGEYLSALVPDARETVAELLALGRSVRIISGGLRPPVESLGLALGLRPEDIAAVGIRFDDLGRYAGYEEASPLARSGGKEEVIRGWALPRPILLVGDGATDLEARGAVDCFAAFMGIVDRPMVAAGADVVLRQPRLAPVLALAASVAERERIRAGATRELLEDGEALLAEAIAPPSKR
jgi:phosphoserine phosphatase